MSLNITLIEIGECPKSYSNKVDGVKLGNILYIMNPYIISTQELFN